MTNTAKPSLLPAGPCVKGGLAGSADLPESEGSIRVILNDRGYQHFLTYLPDYKALLACENAFTSDETPNPA